MRDSVTLDRAGRLVLPKHLRNEMHLAPGDTLEIALTGDELTLRPRRGATPLQKERGVWVLRTAKPLSAAEASEALRNIRAGRDRHNAADSR